MLPLTTLRAFVAGHCVAASVADTVSVASYPLLWECAVCQTRCSMAAASVQSVGVRDDGGVLRWSWTICRAFVVIGAARVGVSLGS